MATKNPKAYDNGRTNVDWYTAKGKQVIDSVNVPISREEVDRELGYMSGKAKGNEATAKRVPELKGISDFANEGINEQIGQLRKARQQHVGAGRGEVNPPVEEKKKGGAVMRKTKRYERGGDVDEGVSGGAPIDEYGRRIAEDMAPAEEMKAPAEVKLTPKQAASLNSDGGTGRVTGTRDDDFGTAGVKTANTRNAAGDFYTAQGTPFVPFRPYASTGNSNEYTDNKKRGGVVKKMASGGSVSSRADGIAQRGKTKGRMC